MRLAAALAALGASLVLASCGETRRARVPDVSGESLDVAEADLDAADLHYSVVGGGTFGVIVRSHWQVCRQSPKPGAVATKVTLVVARACDRPSPGRTAVVPDVEYESLDAAEAQLAKAGLGWKVESDRPIFDRSDWEVCDQNPGPGEWAKSVELYVDRSCDDWRW